MKYRLHILLVLLTLNAGLIFFSCNKDQSLLNEIEGQYTIESIVNYSNGQPDLTDLKGTIYFEKCKMKKSTDRNCSGWIDLKGKDRITFKYNISDMKLSGQISIHSLSEPLNETVLSQTFEFNKSGENILDLKGPYQTATRNGQTTTYYNEIKLKK